MGQWGMAARALIDGQSLSAVPHVNVEPWHPASPHDIIDFVLCCDSSEPLVKLVNAFVGKPYSFWLAVMDVRP